VLECWDREVQEYVAIKVIRNVQKYRDAAMIEIDVLRTLAKNDKTGMRSACFLILTLASYS
jgi:dual-specificity kinase